MAESSEHRIDLQDKTADMADSAKGTTEQAQEQVGQSAGSGAEGPLGHVLKGWQDDGKEQAHWISAPENLGNKYGEKVESFLQPVGNKTGKPLEMIGRPVGGLVDPLVGGVMKGGKGWGETLGVGFGNAEGGPAKAAEAEHQRMKEPLGGKEQTGENPLGL